MLLYKCNMDSNKLLLAKSLSENIAANVMFTTKNKEPFNEELNYIPIKNTSNILTSSRNKNIATVAINFVGKARGVKIRKGFSSLEVFGGSFHISENYVRIMGNFNLEKYSKSVPMLSLIVESFKEGEENSLKSIGFYYENNKGKPEINIRERVYDKPFNPISGKIVNLTFYKRGVETVYIVPSQRILSDLSSKESVVEAIGRKPDSPIFESIYLAPTADEAKELIHKQKLNESQIILISKSYKRNDIF